MNFRYKSGLMARELKLMAREPKLLARELKLLAREPKLLAREPKLLARELKLLAHEASLHFDVVTVVAELSVEKYRLTIYLFMLPSHRVVTSV
jgi:hypothetical protein